MTLADYEDPWVAPPRSSVQGPLATPRTYSFIPEKALPLDSDPGCWTAPDLFWPETPSYEPNRVQAAKAMCRRCPVREACLGLGKDEPEGIWGGLTPRERRHPGRTKRRPVKAPPVPTVKAPPVPPEPVDDCPLAQVIQFPMDRVRPHPLCPPNVDDCSICYPDG